MYRKKLISVALSVVLVTTCLPPREAKASWFSDLMGGMFTIITAPMWIFCQDNPTFRKNNSFRKKLWQEEAEIEERVHNYVAKLPPRIEREVIREVEPNTTETFLEELVQKVIKHIKTNHQLFKELFKEEIAEIILSVISSEPDRFRGERGRDGAKGDKGDRGADGKDGTCQVPRQQTPRPIPTKFRDKRI